MQHGLELCSLYDSIVESLLTSSKPLCRHKTAVYKGKPGWNECMFLACAESGRQKCGPVFEYKKKANAKLKYALRFIKRNENTMRSDSLANKLHSNSPRDFWK